MRTAFMLAALAALSLVTGCDGSSSENTPSTTTKEVADMKVDEASRIVVANFALIWPEPIQVDSSMVSRGVGCRTNPVTLESEGPPWTPFYEKTVTEPTSEFIDRALAQLDTMTKRGFSLQPNPIPGDDSVNRTYTDGRGFSVAAHRDKYPVGVQFTMTSSSPCVDE